MNKSSIFWIDSHLGMNPGMNYKYYIKRVFNKLSLSNFQ